MIKVGTSGYSYFWNKGIPTPFKWYINQGFKTVEINSTFYRFPTKYMINTWKDSPEYFDFSIKVHRSITHYSRLSEKSYDLWNRFKSCFKELESKICFWLFQFPENFIPSKINFEKIEKFFNEINLGNKAVLEFRHPLWWKNKEICKKIGAVFCSINAPNMPEEIVSLNNVVYLRLHGKEEWYSYTYTNEEIEEIFRLVYKANAEKKYIYLNNNHGMLPNGKYLMKLIEEIEKKN